MRGTDYLNAGLHRPLSELTTMRNVKEAAKELVESLPEDATWDDLMYQIYVRQNLEAGLADSEAGRVTDVEDVRREFGLSG